MHILCVNALKLLSVFLGQDLAFLVKTGWQPCCMGHDVYAEINPCDLGTPTSVMLFRIQIEQMKSSDA